MIIRCDSAAIVPKTSELLPEPETPVNTVSRRFGISTLTFLRLFTRAPCTRIRSWLSAAWGAGAAARPRGDAHGVGGDALRLRTQLTAFFRSAAIFASSAAVSFVVNAKAVGHIVPSSSFAMPSKPSVEYRALNLAMGWKKQRTLPSFA